MGRNLYNFFLYNNTFVLVVLFVLLASGSVFAASEDVRDAVLSSEAGVVSIDNSYIIKVNLDNFDFRIKVTEVVKDDLNYYVSYEFHTIELVDSVWQKTVKLDVLTVNIEQLGERDLGLYVAEELSELVDKTKSFLSEVQLSEKETGESRKTIARTYKGLVGRYLEPDEMTFNNYDPVIEPPAIIVVNEPDPEEGDEVEEIDVDDVIDDPEIIIDEDDDEATTTLDTTKPVISLNGEVEANLLVGEAYFEQGAMATDDIDGDLTNSIVIGGLLDTNIAGQYQLTYSVSDQAGNSATVERKVFIEEAEVVASEPELDGADTSETIEPSTEDGT